MRWAYGDAGDRIPVAPGETWQVGPHVVACADLATDDGRAALHRAIGPRVVSLFYTDPPWGQALTTGFRAKSGVPGGTSFPDLMTTLLSVAIRLNPLTIGIEMSEKETPFVAGLLRQAAHDVEDIPIVYYRRRPARLLLWRLTHAADEWRDHARALLAGADDTDTPALCVAEYTEPDSLVVDPCCGRGLTAVAAATAGRVFAGGELAPRRMAVTLDKLSAITGRAPERVGVLP
jgi:hypothetical protein